MEENILNALNSIVVNIKNSDLNPFNPDFGYFESINEETGMLQEKLGLTPLQSFLLGLSIEGAAGKRTSYRDIANEVGCSYLELMSHATDFQALRRKGYLRITEEKISVPAEVMSALMHNRPFVRTEPTGCNTEAILAKMRRYLGRVRRDMMTEELFVEEIDLMIRCNPETSIGMAFNKHIAPLHLQEQERYLFYLALYGARFHVNQFSVIDVQDFFADESCYDEALFFLEHCHESLDLFKNNIFEEVTIDGMAENGQYKIREDIVEDFLKEASPDRKNKTIWLEDSDKYVSKELFYNEAESRQVQRLTSLLSPDNLGRVFNSMKEKGMRTGFTCLFYGAPGTGKTETALQLAKATGRKVLSADIASIMSKWVGESEKNARRLFQDYRRANDENELTPILLLNEADAFLGKRFENVRSSTEKMENGLQNIFLEELERFNGILIATTNLTDNLDPAFERRFLFKVCFDKPSEEVRANIWKSNIPELSEDEARKLAAAYDFSGGQIENIVRQKDIEAILNNIEPDFATICRFCDEERITDRRKPIGFQTL